MKKIFVPSMDELYEMQDMRINIYKYLMVKVIEILTMRGINNPDQGILKNAFSYLRENPYIASAICSMYPEELEYSFIASTDVDLCLKLLRDNEKNSICSLDYLSKFDPSILDNKMILREVIVKLEKVLRENPKYRFEYQENNKYDIVIQGPTTIYKNTDLLTKILNREITDDDMMLLRDIIPELLNIEPAYGITLSDWYFDKGAYERSSNVSFAVNNYADTYGIPSYVGTEYIGKDILTNPDKDVKRLLRCINTRNR